MKTILICDDSLEDIEKIESALEPLVSSFSVTIRSVTDIQKAVSEVSKVNIDLLLLDLEFTKQDTNAMFYLDKIPSTLPVIIVSHLEHYQRQVNTSLRVRTFVSKGQLRKDDNLLRTVQEILFPKKTSIFDEVFTFPMYKEGIIAEKISIRNIRYIQMISRGKYEVHYISPEEVESLDSTSKHPEVTHIIRSKPFCRVCEEIKNQHVTGLIPISQSILINSLMIKNINYLENGRLEITLIGLPGEVFSVGEKYMSYFKENTYLRRTPLSYRWKNK